MWFIAIFQSMQRLIINYKKIKWSLDLKENLTELLIYSDEIKDELHFLDEQLVYADQQNLKLKTESDNLKELVLKENPDFNLE